MLTPKEAGHQARKRFGQNFLVNPQVIHNIMHAIHPQEKDCIVEIGPGLGALTEHLIDSRCQLTLVELDRDLVPKLAEAFGHQGEFNILNADALQIDFGSLSREKGQSLRVVGNLPYNISTPLMFHLLTYREYISDMYFMLQREVVKRICAEPGSSAWGRLSIMMQYHANVESVLDVPPEAFDPAPKVESAIVRIQPRTWPGVQANSIAELEKIVRIAFNKRRKTLRNVLKELLSEAEITALGINPSARPETLSLDDYIRLSNATLANATAKKNK